MESESLTIGAQRVAAAVMGGAVRKSARDRGADPSEFALVAFGGAGGLHAVDLAVDIGIHRILFPREAGVFSALGMTLTRQRRDKLHHMGHLWERDSRGEDISERVQSYITDAEDGEEIALLARCRYPGQRFFIEIPFSNDLLERFDREHQARFGMSRPNSPVEIVTLVVSTFGPKPDIPPPSHSPVKADYPIPNGALAWCELDEGAEISGPIAVVGREATAWIPEGCVAEVDNMGNLRMEVHR
jgi:N-methylhydantoinase A